MADTEKLKTHAIDALNWIDNHWGPGRFVLSCLAIAPIAFILVGAVLGAVQAYTVDSASAIVPMETWAEISNAGSEMSSPLEAAILAGIGAMMLGTTEFVGRITYAYLLWVPEPVWSAMSVLVLLIPTAIILFNLVWAFQKVYRMRDPSLQAPEGGIDG